MTSSLTQGDGMKFDQNDNRLNLFIMDAAGFVSSMHSFVLKARELFYKNRRN